jgi:DivIVA domain-containing protein
VTGDEVRAVTFREKLRGYRPSDVDDLLKRVAHELDAGRSPVPLLESATFRAKIRGYHPADVDRFLDRLRMV